MDQEEGEEPADESTQRRAAPATISSVPMKLDKCQHKHSPPVFVDPTHAEYIGCSSYFSMGLLVPSVMWRLASILLANEARTLLLNAASEEIIWNIDLKADNKCIDSERIDCYRNLSPTLPPTSSMLTAMTPLVAQETFNSERLEFLGDSFLKYAITIELYRMYPNCDEGSLSNLRSEVVSNNHLRKMSSEKGLTKYLRGIPFTHGKRKLKLRPPGMRNVPVVCSTPASVKSIRKKDAEKAAIETESRINASDGIAPLTVSHTDAPSSAITHQQAEMHQPSSNHELLTPAVTTVGASGSSRINWDNATATTSGSPAIVTVDLDTDSNDHPPHYSPAFQQVATFKRRRRSCSPQTSSHNSSDIVIDLTLDDDEIVSTHNCTSVSADNIDMNPSVNNGFGDIFTNETIVTTKKNDKNNTIERMLESTLLQINQNQNQSITQSQKSPDLDNDRSNQISDKPVPETVMHFNNNMEIETYSEVSIPGKKTVWNCNISLRPRKNEKNQIDFKQYASQITTTTVNAKCLADIVESVVACFYLHGGVHAAVCVMKCLGIWPVLKQLQTTNSSEERLTASPQKFHNQQLTSSHVGANTSVPIPSQKRRSVEISTAPAPFPIGVSLNKELPSRADELFIPEGYPEELSRLAVLTERGVATVDDFSRVQGYDSNSTTDIAGFGVNNTVSKGRIVRSSPTQVQKCKFDLLRTMTFPEASDEITASIFSKLGYRFHSSKYLLEALTHPSCDLRYNYERLEFLGDAVLDFAVVTMLYETHPNASEGDLSQMKSDATCNKRLASVALRLQLYELMQINSISIRNIFTNLKQTSKLGPKAPSTQDKSKRDFSSDNLLVFAGLTKSEQTSAEGCLADMTEALIGAIFIDCGGDLQVIYDLVKLLRLSQQLTGND